MKTVVQPGGLYRKQSTGIIYIELIFRIVVGLFLVFDGIHILSHNVQLQELFSKTMSIHTAVFLINFIGVAHLLGGTFIVIGLLTRVAIVVQVPAILAEMYYVQPPGSFLGDWEILGSAILLVLLVFLFIKNSGRFSMDYFRKRKQL